MNPAHVLAMYPASISGALAQPRSHWLAMVGAPVPPKAAATTTTTTDDDDDTSALSAPALDALARFLNDRRRLLRPLVASYTHTHPLDTSVLLSLPAWACPLTSLTPEQGMAMAQAVDTALFHVFLRTKPSLVGPMCRVANWCQVADVEAQLRAHGKMDELLALYRGKAMHSEAMALLRARYTAATAAAAAAADDDAQREATEPALALQAAIQYLQALEADHVDLMLDEAPWILDAAPDEGLAIFTCEEHLTTLPPMRVAHALAQHAPTLAITYMERVLAAMPAADVPPALPTFLATLYLTAAAAHSDVAMSTLEHFLHTSTSYDAAAVLQAMPPRPAMPRIRAWLLGRVQRHAEALTLYLCDLNDMAAAARYCDVYDGDVLTLFVRIVVEHRRAWLPEALRVLTRHARHVDMAAILPLLPAAVPVQDVAALCTRAWRWRAAQRDEIRVQQALYEAQDVRLTTQVRALQARHVLVSDGRTCTLCQRRLGHAVLAVMPATGATMHYYCAMKPDAPGGI